MNRHPQKSLTRTGLAAALFALCAAAPAAVGIDTGKTRISATFKQMNVPVDSPFTQASGSVLFDPKKPEAASARIEVATASFDLGDADYNAEARKPEWLSSTAYPKASFVSTAFKPLGGDRYQASGTLTLKGKVLPVNVPVTVKREAAATVFTGSLPISRKAFAIGDPAWNEVVDDTVTVNFRVVQPF